MRMVLKKSVESSGDRCFGRSVTFRLIDISLDDNNLKQYVESYRFNFPVYSNLAPDGKCVWV